MTVVGMEWMWRRTKRMADSLFADPILQGADQVAEALDRYCEINGIERDRINVGDAKFIKGMDYAEYPLEVR